MKKRLFILLAAALMLGVATPTMAQQKKTTAKRTTTTTKKKSGTATKKQTSKKTATPALKNPLVGNWGYDDGHYGLELYLKETCKKGNFIFNEKTTCHGGLAVTEYYEYFIMLSMQVKEVISDTEVVYTVWGEDQRKKTKSVKGTIRLKKIGKNLKITGTESNGKKWLFDGYTLNGYQ